MAEERYEEEEYEEEELSVEEMIEQELKDVYAEMRKYSRVSQEYAVLSQRAIDLTEQKRNIDESNRNQVQADEMRGQRLVPYFQIAGNIAGSALGAMAGQWFNRKTVNDVLDCERNGGIVTSKATQFMQKPRM